MHTMFRRGLLAVAALAASITTAAATCSTVNPNIPGARDPLASAPVRQNFAAAYTDINNLMGMFAGATAPAAPCTNQFWIDTTTIPNRVRQWDGAAWVLWGYLNRTTHVFSPAMTSGSIVTTAPLTSSFSLGVATLGFAYDTNFAVVANQLALAPIASGNMMANSTAGAAEPTSTTGPAWLDRWCAAVNDSFVYRTGGTWGCSTLLGAPHTWTGTQTFAAILATSLNGISYPSSANSGGIPYFASNTFLSSSVALATNGFVLGGGAGGAPTSTATPTAGQIPIGQPAGAPVLAVLSGDAVNNSAGVTTIQNNVVTVAKLQQLAALSLLGNCSNAAANMAAQTGGADQVMRVNGAGTSCAFGAIDLSKPAAATGVLQGASMPALSGDVANSPGSLATTIQPNVVSYSKFQQVAANNLVGNSTGSLANAGGISLGAMLAFSAGALQTGAGTGDVTWAANSFSTTISANAVTNTKSAQMAAATVKGNPTNATANATDFTIQGLTDIGAPNTTLDFLPIYNHTTGTIQKTTAAELVAAVGGGVTSVAPGGGLASTVTASAPGSAITSTGTLYGAQLINAQGGTSYAIVDGDRAKLITASNTAAMAYTIAQAGAASAFQSGWYVDINNISTNDAGVVTITPTTSTISVNGVAASTLTLPRSMSARIVSDGANYYAVVNGRAGFNAYLSANQTGVSSGVLTKVQFNTKSGSVSGQYDGATNYRFTPLIPGAYLVTITAFCDGTTVSGSCIAAIYKNGSIYKEIFLPAQTTGGGVLVAGQVPIAAGDYIEGFARVNCASSCFFDGGTGPQLTYIDVQLAAP